MKSQYLRSYSITASSDVAGLVGWVVVCSSQVERQLPGYRLILQTGDVGCHGHPMGIPMAHAVKNVYIHEKVLFWLVLVGALEPWIFSWLSIYWECHHPNWLLKYFSEGWLNHQPDWACVSQLETPETCRISRIKRCWVLRDPTLNGIMSMFHTLA
jgi:hypothetical protein